MNVVVRDPCVSAAPPGALAALTLARYRASPGRMVMPDICCDLVWARGRLWLTGPMTRAARSQNVGEEVTLMRLDPLVARAWLRIPLSYFTDTRLPLADVAPRLAQALDNLREAGAIETLVRPAGDVIQAGVDARLVVAMRALKRGTTVGEVAQIVSLSERQLERVVAEQLGVAPKTLTRIVRFRRALASAKSGASLSEAAAAAGYADQAHFSRDARALTGQSPRALLPNVGNVQDVVAGAL